MSPGRLLFAESFAIFCLQGWPARFAERRNRSLRTGKYSEIPLGACPAFLGNSSFYDAMPVALCLWAFCVWAGRKSGLTALFGSASLTFLLFPVAVGKL